MIGIIAALAVAAVIVWTVMSHGTYRSMLFDGPDRSTVPAAAGAAVPEPAVSAAEPSPAEPAAAADEEPAEPREADSTAADQSDSSAS